MASAEVAVKTALQHLALWFTDVVSPELRHMLLNPSSLARTELAYCRQVLDDGPAYFLWQIVKSKFVGEDLAARDRAFADIKAALAPLLPSAPDVAQSTATSTLMKAGGVADEAALHSWITSALSEGMVLFPASSSASLPMELLAATVRRHRALRAPAASAASTNIGSANQSAASSSVPVMAGKAAANESAVSEVISIAAGGGGMVAESRSAAEGSEGVSSSNSASTAQASAGGAGTVRKREEAGSGAEEKGNNAETGSAAKRSAQDPATSAAKFSSAAPSASPDDTLPLAEQTITVTLKRSDDGSSTVVKTKRGIRIGFLKAAMCRRWSIDPSSFKFVFEGEMAFESHTLLDWGVEDGDVIEVFMLQVGD